MATITNAEIADRLSAAFPGSQGKELYAILTALNDEVDATATIANTATSTNTTQGTSITNLNAWATALATKLNADGGVTDVNYDTDPQA